MDATPILVPEPDPAEDAHTISRKGARMPQVEVITRGVSIGVQTGPLIGVQKGPRLGSGLCR